MPEPTAAVFLDRDGTLNEMIYNETHGLLDSPFRVEDLRLCPGAAEFTRAVRERGYLAIVVTNQPGVAKGTLTEEGLARIHGRLEELLAERGGALDGIRYCPHHPEGRAGVSSPFVRACGCRKPAPGMLLEAAHDQGINLANSWMVGDGLNDVQAGRAAGCRTILITRLKLEHLERLASDSTQQPDYVVRDLNDALRRVLGATGEMPQTATGVGR